MAANAAPADVSWDPGAPGAFVRSMRFGEWISEPVTPLFESWLLTTMEERLHALNRTWVGQIAPRPYHVIVNGWYFYSLNFLSGRALLRSLPGIVRQLFHDARRVAVAIPQFARHSVPVYESEWRDDILPRYRAAVAAAEGRVDSVQVGDLPGLIDGMADLAGEYFASIAVVAGSAYKLEVMLARSYGRSVRPLVGGTHLELLAGLEAPGVVAEHAVSSLDWYQPTLRSGAASPGSLGAADAADAAVPIDRGNGPRQDHRALVETRLAAEAAVSAALETSPRRLAAFRDLLAETQRLVVVREEQVRELTIAWPVMRRAVVRIGEELAARGATADAEDVFFMTRDETLRALEADAGSAAAPPIDTGSRRALLAEQRALVPPLIVGRLNPFLRRLWDSWPRMVGAVPSEHAIVLGTPASPGRATGRVRVVHGPESFDSLLPGEILVAPITAPAWTPLFERAAAVVTDVGSLAAHASVIAREYGIPAVVGCGDATTRLETGTLVTVDGTTGNVEPA